MASAAQISANRQNSLKSKGPSTPPGKAASSRNAVKHGLAGSTTAALMTTEGDRALLDRRRAGWAEGYAPEGIDEAWLFEQVVAESIRVDRCTDAYFALCRDHGRRAERQWDADRRREADDLAASLARSPHTVARRIEGTPQGCDLMIDLWRGLSSSLERHETWTDPQRSLALDLLGIRPELRDAETPVDPAEGDAFEARRAVIASEIARLEALRDGDLAVLDAEARARAETSLGAELTKPLQLIDRYNRAAWRRLEWARRQLEASRRDREGSTPNPAAVAPTPKAVTPPPAPPRPAPAPAPALAGTTFVKVSATPPAPAPKADRPTPAVPATARPAVSGPNRHERPRRGRFGPPLTSRHPRIGLDPTDEPRRPDPARARRPQDRPKWPLRARSSPKSRPSVSQ